jgi:hypothetical protein
MGLSDNWDFEEDFLRRTGARVICFDHSVSRGFWVRHALESLRTRNFRRLGRYFAYRKFFHSHAGVSHRRLMIGYDGPATVSLDSIIKETAGDAIFLKIDIEGSEYRILDDILKHAQRLTAVAIEFHDVDLHRERLSSFLDQLRDFEIVYLHPNNCGGVDAAGDPLVLEMTLTRRTLIEPASTTAPTAEAPSPPNDPARPNIKISFAVG